MWWLRFREVIESKVKQLIDVRCRAVATWCVGNSALYQQAEPTAMAAGAVGSPHVSFVASGFFLLALLLVAPNLKLPHHNTNSCLSVWGAGVNFVFWTLLSLSSTNAH